ncbi:pH-response regulator protein palF/prr-3 [Madurella mycetomatis]|uniref:PH-response regulator protein palF/prr-3 n=1 Tax=Madurella mycetomatis TaxID=100816 RepID=A0A175W3V3_9PEZI|nr:pH-response regulator protein palF/prr-3 [Madurella mycetomatis]
MSAPYVVGDSSPFLKRVLIPFWIIRIIIMLVQIALYALVIAAIGLFRDDPQRLFDEYHTELNVDAVLAVAAVMMIIILICLILDLVSIIKRARRTLSPPFFLGVNVAQSVFYTVTFILGMIGAHNGALSIGISVIVLLSFLGLLIYAAVVFHQYRKGSLRGTYAPTHNPEVHNLVQGNTAYGPQTTYPQPYAQDYPRANPFYDPQAASQATGYGGQGYAPQPYEPQQHSIEMNQRPAATATGV